MDCQVVTASNSYPLIQDRNELVEKLSLIYEEILKIEGDEVNKNIVLINKLSREDPLWIEALKVIQVRDFVLNKNALTQTDIQKITDAYLNLKKINNEKESQLEMIEESLSKTKNLDAFYAALAAISYYSEFHEQKKIQSEFGTFVVQAVVENKEGLRALFIEPILNDNRIISPVVSIRGTVFGHKGNVLDDLHASIGSLAFNAGKERLYELFQEGIKRFPHGFVVLGHSLGGAIAQQIAVAFQSEGFIAQVYHYNAPGIGDDLVHQFLEQQKHIDSNPEIIEIRHKNDIFSYFGGKHLNAAKRIILDDLENSSYFESHEILRIVDKSASNKIKLDVHSEPKEESFIFFGRFSYFSIETMRSIFSPILKIAIHILFKEDVKEDFVLESEALTEESMIIQKHRF